MPIISGLCVLAGMIHIVLTAISGHPVYGVLAAFYLALGVVGFIGWKKLPQ